MFNSSPQNGVSGQHEFFHPHPLQSSHFPNTTTPITGIKKNVLQSCLGTDWANSKSLGPEVHDMEFVSPGLVWIIRLSAALAEQLQLLRADGLGF